MTGEWPLVGRDTEVALLRERVHQRSGVVLAGPAGAGKTRLARVAAEHAEELGHAVLRLAASRPVAGIPLGAVSALLPLQVGAHGATALAQAHIELDAQAAGRPLLLQVDDAQWLDEASAVLVHQLAAGGTATVIATLRLGEPVPDPVVALWKDGLVTRVEVPPLSRDRVRALLQVALGGHVESATSARLYDASKGNVLYLRELVAAALADGSLDKRGGLWQLDGDLPVSPRLTELVAARLGDLDGAERAALELIALGEPLRLTLVDELADPAAIERLEARGLIAVSADGSVDGGPPRVQPGHPLYGEVMRATIPELRRRRLCRSLADAAEHAGLRRASDLLRIAQWRLDAGAPADPEVLVTAARQALWAHDNELAVRLARAAWATGPSFASAHVLADTLYEIGAYAERETFLALLAAGAGNDIEVAVVAMARSTGFFWGLQDAAGADQVLLDAEAVVTDPDWLAETMATRATLNSQAGRHQLALQLLASLPPHTGDRALVQKALAAAFSLPAVGRAREALVTIDEAIEAHRRMGRQPTLYQERLLHAARGMALAALGALSEAEQVLARGLDEAIDDNDVAATGFIACALGWVMVNQGRLADALLQYREAAAAFEEVAHVGPRRWALGGIVLAGALGGDPEAVAQALDDLDALGAHPARLFEATIERARAWADIADGHPQRARDRLMAAALAAQAEGRLLDEAHVRYDLSLLGAARAMAPRLEMLAKEADGNLVAAFAAHATALAGDDASGLAAAVELLAGMGVNLRAAEAANSASEAAARDGDQRLAARLSRRSLDLSQQCQGASTPTLVRIGAAVPLTRREREIALLAADGIASKVIAERLFLSVRTVDNHLARIYVKLGVTGRADLAAALGVRT